MNKVNNDLKTAIEMLNNDNLTICVVKNDKVIYKSKEKGIAPLYKAYEGCADFSGCSVADKVVGLGAAYFYQKLNAKQIHANIVSKLAIEYLDDSDIDVKYNIFTDKILNREKNGFCPVECLAIKSAGFDDFLNGVKNFLSSINII